MLRLDRNVFALRRKSCRRIPWTLKNSTTNIPMPSIQRNIQKNWIEKLGIKYGKNTLTLIFSFYPASIMGFVSSCPKRATISSPTVNHFNIHSHIQIHHINDDSTKLVILGSPTGDIIWIGLDGTSRKKNLRLPKLKSNFLKNAPHTKFGGADWSRHIFGHIYFLVLPTFDRSQFRRVLKLLTTS